MTDPPKQNKWIETHRSYFITRLYGDFQALFLSFQDIYLAFIDSGGVSFEEISRLVGTEDDRGGLWRLKDLCHHLWRQTGGGELEGFLLDWTIGSLFHETMKLKENIYLMENYRPLMEQAAREGNLPVRGGHSFCSHECRCFMARTATEITRQMDSLGFLFGQANYLLRIMLAGQSSNSLLLRFLAEHEELAEHLWMETVESIFSEMFDGRPEQGYCAAAASLTEGHWFARAARAYEKALALDSDCSEARRHLPQLRIMADQVRGAPA